MNFKTVNPWAWIPTLYFAQGIPYFIVNTVSVMMFTKMGVPNGEMAFFTSLLYLPWMIKPFWSPFVDIIKTKRWWTVAMQMIMAAAFILLTITLPVPEAAQIEAGTTPMSMFYITLILFIITAFASATHDIAADGFYMLALSTGDQAQFVGIRSTFYRLSSIFGQGVLVWLAGVIETSTGDIPNSWRITMLVTAVIFSLVTLYHTFVVPRPAGDTSSLKDDKPSVGAIFAEFGRTFKTYFMKPGVVLAIVFMLLYRLPEAFLLKLCMPFLVAAREAGGLGMSTANVGLAYGTIGVIGLLVGGIVGGICISRGGLKKWILPMAFAINVPDLLYVLLAYTQTDSFPLVIGCVACEQLGYGFGFTAFTMYLVYVAQGLFKTAHYSIGTGLMALGMMVPGMIAGYLQEWTGYPIFFVIVCILTIPGIFASYLVMKKLPADFGKMDKSK